VDYFVGGPDNRLKGGDGEEMIHDEGKE